MYNKIVLVCVFICSVWCRDNNNVIETVEPDSCQLAKQIEELKVAVLNMRKQFANNISDSIEYEVSDLPIKEDIHSLKTLVQKQHKLISSSSSTILNQDLAMSELKELIVDVYGNLSRMIAGIEKKTEVQSSGYDMQNVWTDDRGKPLKEYPFLALLGYGTSLDNVDWRGDVGIIINERYVIVTGWRATEPHNGGLKYLALGVKNRSGSRKSWQVHQVKRMVVHPGYKRYGYADDVAVVETVKPMLFNDRVQPACLPTADRYDAEATLATWWHSYSRVSVDYVRTVNVQRYSQTECVEMYHQYNQTTQLCYGHREDLRASCDSWSSDPLVVKYEDSSCSTVIGIRWYGTCSHPDVYTMLYQYVPWIQSVTQL